MVEHMPYPSNEQWILKILAQMLDKHLCKIIVIHTIYENIAKKSIYYSNWKFFHTFNNTLLFNLSDRHNLSC